MSRIILLLAAAAVPPEAWSQCAMCRTVAAQANGIDKAILVLFVPAVLLFCGVFVFAFRSQGADDGAGPGDE
jgi:hypothetical protein